MSEFLQEIMHEFHLPLQNPVLVFALILFIILLAPILLKRLNIPGIIGLIIAGVIIGPHGLYLLENNSAVELFSTIGILYIMFIAGLELDMNEFTANFNKSLTFGAFTFAIPLAIGYPVCHYLLGYDFNSSFLTASMFATHTLVAYPIVSDFGLSKNQAVAITVGGTILTDTAVLIILAVILGNHAGSLNQEFWIRLGISLIIFSLIMFWIIPKIARWFFSHLESEKHSHYIFVLAIVFLAAFLAEIAGLEAIIGAFAAGLALNTLIPKSSALMNRIEFIGNSLFIPFFLISVGMIVNIQVLTSGYMAWVIAGALTLVAVSGKWLAAYFTQLTFKYSGAQRQIIFGLSGAHAAATLAVILVGFEAGILDENILNGTIILILITCIIASFATEKAAKELVQDKEGSSENNGTSNPFALSEHILLPIANVENMGKLLELAIYLKDEDSANPVSILRVVSNDREAETNILKAKEKLEDFVKQASASETKVDIITTIDYNTASGIARISKEIIASIIILGWPRHPDFFDRLIGEMIDRILDNTDKSIFICHVEKPFVQHKRIVVAAPPLAELEAGFDIWFKKMVKLAQELSIPIQLYCNRMTEVAINILIKKHKVSARISIVNFVDWKHFLNITKEINQDDLVVLISSRRGGASHLNALDNMPYRLTQNLPHNSRFVIYPQKYSSDAHKEIYTDVSPEPLNRGIETIQRLGKGIGDIFKREDIDRGEKE